jgi:hypothetical protein
MSQVISQYFKTTALRSGQRFAMASTANLIFGHVLRRRERFVELETVPGTTCLQEVPCGTQSLISCTDFSCTDLALLVSLDNANL